jgi:hypothetical protein
MGQEETAVTGKNRIMIARAKASDICSSRCPSGGGGEKREHLDFYDIDISSMNLRHHWNPCSRTSAANVSDLPSVIHSSEACTV